MGDCLTSACISLAIARLTRSIWRSLQGSPLLPSPSLAWPSTAQIDLVATVCPHPNSQSAPSLDPIWAPAIMSSLIWTCHTSPDTYPRHAVTFCPTGARKRSRGFLPLPSSPTLSVVLFSIFLPFFSLSHTFLPSFLHFLCWLLSLLSLSGFYLSQHVKPPAVPLIHLSLWHIL